MHICRFSPSSGVLSPFPNHPVFWGAPVPQTTLLRGYRPRVTQKSI